MNIKEIVQEWLSKNKCDGLCNSFAECGCSINNLMLCDSYSKECEAAIRDLTKEEEWYIPKIF